MAKFAAYGDSVPHAKAMMIDCYISSANTGVYVLQNNSIIAAFIIRPLGNINITDALI